MKILFNTEATFLGTGYSTYGKQVISRLFNTGKYDIAELGSFANPNDERIKEIPWKFFSAKSSDKNTNDTGTAFGKTVFNQIVAEFKPHVVCSFRDPWMCSFEAMSPLRKFYRHIIMPTVDAIPQKDNWLSLYASADKVLCYTDWAVDVLKESLQTDNIGTSASPAADYNVFKPILNRKAFRDSVDINQNALIIGTVMRNQKRKLYPKLIKMFEELYEKAPEHIKRRLYLYLHVCWPDIGWDIPLLIKESPLAHRIFMTYTCGHCGAVFPSVFGYAVTSCRACGKNGARTPDTQRPLSREILAKLMCTFDAYVQYSNAGGFEMPQVEAAACGVPVFSVDYAAMSDVVRKIKGYPIKVLTLEREMETHRYMAVPDNSNCADQLLRFLSLPPEVRHNIGHQCHVAATSHYTWDKAANTWDLAIQDVLKNYNPSIWDSPADIHSPTGNIPANATYSELVKYCLVNIANRPELVNTFFEASLVRDLTWNAKVSNIQGYGFNEMSFLSSMPVVAKFDKEDLVEECLKLVNEKNQSEQMRIACK